MMKVTKTREAARSPRTLFIRCVLPAAVLLAAVLLMLTAVGVSTAAPTSFMKVTWSTPPGGWSVQEDVSEYEDDLYRLSFTKEWELDPGHHYDAVAYIQEEYRDYASVDEFVSAHFHAPPSPDDTDGRYWERDWHVWDTGTTEVGGRPAYYLRYSYDEYHVGESISCADRGADYWVDLGDGRGAFIRLQANGDSWTSSTPLSVSEVDKLWAEAESIFKSWQYSWEGATTAPPTVQTTSTTEAPETTDTLRLRGLVKSVEGKPMPWFKLQACVFYDTDTYGSKKSYDRLVQGATDYKGRYCLEIPLRPDDEGPVGILLIGTMECLLHGRDQAVFYFVDMMDGYSRSNDQVSLATWITVDPTDRQPGADPDAPIDVYHLLAFYHLGMDAWGVDSEWMPDPVYHFSSDPDHPERLQDYSALYTAAWDAWFFGAAVLEEEEALTHKALRIEVRWPPSHEIAGSHYDFRDHSVRLAESQSKRGDASRYVILHEFGHSFDYATNTGGFRAEKGRGPDDVSHGGYLNETTSDSFMEGFATLYAGLTQRFLLYDNPSTLDWIDLSDPAIYTAWGENGYDEELAIASFLYNALPLVGDIQDYWSLLKPDRLDFSEYYRAFEEHLEASSPEDAGLLADYAFAAGLFRMPFGNGQYDPGEPFLDLPEEGGSEGNGWYDLGEPFADLMYDVGDDGYIDPSRPLRPYERDDITIGEVSDAQRLRRTLLKPENNYLHLYGETPGYLLVTVHPDGADAWSSLREVEDGRLFMGLPEAFASGTVEVAVPGGAVVFSGDLAPLQQRLRETTGLTAPLAEAHIDAADLAPPGTEVVATYSDPDATGVLTIPDLDIDGLIKEARRYDPDATMAEIKSELLKLSSAHSTDPSVGSTGTVTTKRSSSKRSAPGIVVVSLMTCFIIGSLAMILVAVLRRPSPHETAPRTKRAQTIILAAVVMLAAAAGLVAVLVT